MGSPSPEYSRRLEEAKLHHATSKTFSGKFLRPHAPFIKEIAERLHCRTILDYGCGKGAQYDWRNADPTGSIPVGMTIEEYWGIPVRRYDPAWPPYAKEPVGKFDLVICTHVLGSIPIVDLPWAIKRLYSLARKALYVAEKIGPVGKEVHGDRDGLPNGWKRKDWESVLWRFWHDGPEVTLATREKTPDGVIMTRALL